MKNEINLLIPKSVTFQILDENSKHLMMKNILCHLNIFIGKNSYHSYSFIPTNINGQISLTKEEIINYTELKGQNISIKNTKIESTKFEFYIIDHEIINITFNALNKYLNLSEENILSELRKIFNNEITISTELEKFKLKQIEDQKLFRVLEKSRNSRLLFSSNKSKISGEWKQEIDYTYELKLNC